jgi:hypothetical protein
MVQAVPEFNVSLIIFVKAILIYVAFFPHPQVGLFEFCHILEKLISYF